MFMERTNLTELKFVIQWNLVIKRSDITKPSYHKVILLVPALYISLFFDPDIMRHQGGISLSVLSVFFTDKFALSQSDARISVAYKICQ